MTLWHDRILDKLERGIETWAQKWWLAPEQYVDSKGRVSFFGYVQYPARLLLPPCLAGIFMFGVAHGTVLGNFVAVLCIVLSTMLGSVVYCFAKLRVAALLPELDGDDVVRVARFVMSPAFGIEALRIILAMVISVNGDGDILPLFRNAVDASALFHNPSEILTVIGFATIVLRLHFSIRQLDRRRPGRMLVANGILLIMAMALSYWLAGLGIFWGIFATETWPVS